MRTVKAFYDHTTDEPVPAEVLEIRPLEDKTAVILDKTIFYPEGGGQPSDRGFINGIPLLDVQEMDDEILHFISSGDAKNLSQGRAELILDARRRRELSSQHTGQHILSGTILRLLGAATVSMHMGDETSTIDVDKPGITLEDLASVEDTVQDIIEEDCPIIVHSCPPEDVHSFNLRRVPPQGEDVIRVVEIRGYDFTPCCGTHLSSSGKVGIFRVIGADRYKGMTRITFIAGRRVHRESRLMRVQAEGVSRTLNAPIQEIFPAAETLLKKAEQLEYSINMKDMELAQLRAVQLLLDEGLYNSTDSTRIYKKLFPDISQDEAFLTAKAAQKMCGCILAFASAGDKRFSVLASQKGIDIRPLFKGLMENQDGQGGGGPLFFQGAFSTRAALESFINSIPERLENQS